MRFDVLTEEQLEAMKRKLLPGIYTFEVIDASEKVSKSTNKPMIELILKIYDNNGFEFIIYDYLVSDQKSSWKIKDFCESIGKPEIYQTGTINVLSLAGNSGRLATKIERYQERDKARVKEYLPSLEETFKDDDIPF